MNDCIVSIDEEFEGEWVWIRHDYNIRKARKIHKCDECYKDIQKGEKYENFTGMAICYKEYYTYEKSEVLFYDFKTCKDCLSLRDVFFEDFIFGNIWEDFWNHIDNLEEEDIKECLSCKNLGRLTEKGRKTVLKGIEERLIERR